MLWKEGRRENYYLLTFGDFRLNRDVVSKLMSQT